MSKNKQNTPAAPATQSAPATIVKVDSKTGNLRLADIVKGHPDLQNPISCVVSGGTQGRQPAKVKVKVKDLPVVLSSFIFSAPGSVKVLSDAEKAAAIAGMKNPLEIVAFLTNKQNTEVQIPGAHMTLAEWREKSPDAEISITKGQLKRAFDSVIDVIYDAINPKEEKEVETVANPATPTEA